MGCPKSFSVSGGMGAALLSKPELIHDVSLYNLLYLWLCFWNVFESFLLKTPDLNNIKEEFEHTSNM